MALRDTSLSVPTRPLLETDRSAEPALVTEPLTLDEAPPAPQSGPRAASLRHNVAWTGLGTIVYSACQWLILVVLAKASSPETVGQFSLGLAITGPIMMLASLNLRSIQATDARGEFPFGAYFSVRGATTVAALLFITGMALIGPYSDETRLVILMLAVAKAIDAFSDTYYGDLQRREHMAHIGISQATRGVTSIIALALVMTLTQDIVLASAALALSSAAILLVYDRHGRPADAPGLLAYRPKWSELMRLTIIAAPLGIVLLLISLNANIPRYFIQAQFGEHDLGIFSAMAYITVGAGLVSNSLGQGASPRLARYHAEGDYAAFRALLWRLLGITALGGALLTLAVLVAGPTILTLLYTSEYAESSDVFLWLAIGTAIQLPTSILGFGLTAAHRRAVQAPFFVFLTAILTLACFLLVPAYGLVGAAVALTLTNVVQFLGLGALLWSAVGGAAPAPVVSGRASPW